MLSVLPVFQQSEQSASCTPSLAAAQGLDPAQDPRPQPQWLRFRGDRENYRKAERSWCNREARRRTKLVAAASPAATPVAVTATDAHGLTGLAWAKLTPTGLVQLPRRPEPVVDPQKDAQRQAQFEERYALVKEARAAHTIQMAQRHKVQMRAAVEQRRLDVQYYKERGYTRDVRFGL